VETRIATKSRNGENEKHRARARVHNNVRRITRHAIAAGELFSTIRISPGTFDTEINYERFAVFRGISKRCTRRPVTANDKGTTPNMPRDYAMCDEYDRGARRTVPNGPVEHGLGCS